MNIDSVIIKASDNLAEFQFSEREGLFRLDGSEYYIVTLKAENIIASSKFMLLIRSVNRVVVILLI